MSAERAQGRGWVRIPGSRTEQPAAGRSDGYDRNAYDRNAYDRNLYDRNAYDRNTYDRNGYDRGPYDRNGYDRGPYDRDAYEHGAYGRTPPAVQPPIYLSLVDRWREAGRTLPGHPDEEWERLISQPCWPGR